MKKNFLWTMVAATALMGCTNDDLMNESIQVNESNAITFSTYVNKTRASVIDTEHIKDYGFGVSAYYTKDKEFAEGEFDTFMDNTKVYFDEQKNAWTYSPIKYWPNNVDDKLSFFAYAPYDHENITFNDPDNRSSFIFEVKNDVREQVDLIYHKAEGDDVAGVEKSIDLTKPTIGSTINFNFWHALSRIAFDVKAVVDDTDTNSENLLDGNTRINIKKVALISANDGKEYPEALDGPFLVKETFNILNGKWGIYDEERQDYVLNGNTQGFEFDGDDFYRAVDVEGTADVETDNVVQLTKFNPVQRLLNEDSYLMIIPQADCKFRIYIEYDVISEMDNTDGTGRDYNCISNKITSTVMNRTFDAGKAYVFNIRLGMTSAKFDAVVTEWPAEEDADGANETWTPENSED